MSAVIIPFPIIRRYKFVARQVSRVLELNPRTRERHIHLQLKIQAEAMRRKGIAPNLIVGELNSLEFVIRQALSRTLMKPGGAL
jgi:uncharacterized membrane-anchored protein